MAEVTIGATRCERVGVMLPASAGFPAVLIGILWAGRTAVPLNFLMGTTELRPVLADAGLDVVFTVRHFESVIRELGIAALYLENLGLKRRILWSMLKPRRSVPRVQPGDTAVILYTSGTTGEPKGVELSYSNLYSNCVDTIEALAIDPGHRFLNILPPFHVFGLTADVLVPIVLGASVYALPRFNPVGVVRAVAQETVTLLMGIPSMYGAILRSKSARREHFTSVKLAVSGGEPLPARVAAEFQERFGVRLHEGYGLTETSPVLTVCTPRHAQDGTVGRPIPHVEIRIVDEKGQRLGTCEDGEIVVRGPGVMKGYYRKPQETRAVVDAEGWFRTGDVGHLDPEGFLTITGRQKDMLIIGGENVFPREIESVLEAHEGVLQAAVIGVRDEVRGETPVAFVLPQSGPPPDEEALRAFAKKSLAGFKVPRRIVIRDDLPTGPTGKILKRRLRDLL